MAYVTLAAGDVDAKSPVSDALMTLIKTNLDHLESAISDGASASQVLDVNTLTVSGAGTALTVTNDALVSGDATVTGNLTVGSFTVPDTALLMMGW